MGAVFVDQDAVFIQAVVGVAADVVPALQHQHPQAAPLGQLPGGHASGVSGADDQAVKAFFHQVSTFFNLFPVFYHRPGRKETKKVLNFP